MAGAHQRSTSRDDIRRRLGAMDSQIDAIESMAANMESDFRSTKLVCVEKKFLKFLYQTMLKKYNIGFVQK